MKFDVGVPSGAIKHFDSWVGDGDMSDFAVAAEQAGLDSVHVTDHPFPEDSWLASGGHQAFDPFVALATMSAVTTTIGLRTNLLVSGYRHPYLMARSIASLDRLSGGRMIVGMGAGYLEAEFDVLGADFASRGKRFDEALAAMADAWSGETVDRPDGFYPAQGHTMLPMPSQRPGPPVWIGGNSKAAKRRAAVSCDGWIPMAAGPTLASITGTSTLTSLEQLKSEIDEVNSRRAEAGRTNRFDVAFSAFDLPAPADDRSGEQTLDVIGRHEAIGVTWMSLPCRGRSLSACKDELAYWDETIVGPHRQATSGAD